MKTRTRKEDSKEEIKKREEEIKGATTNRLNKILGRDERGE